MSYHRASYRRASCRSEKRREYLAYLRRQETTRPSPERKVTKQAKHSSRSIILSSQAPHNQPTRANQSKPNQTKPNHTKAKQSKANNESKPSKVPYLTNTSGANSGATISVDDLTVSSCRAGVKRKKKKRLCVLCTLCAWEWEYLSNLCSCMWGRGVWVGLMSVH